MKDALHDIVQHTNGLGIELIKVTGDKKSTIINGINEDRSVILDAAFHTPILEFQGLFGMPNLNKLSIILNIPEYREDAKLTIARQQDSDGNMVPCGIDFENKDGDFKNNFRFMVASVVTEKLKSVKFRGVPWDVEVAPTVHSIQRMRFQSQANSEESSFVAKTNNSNLEFHFGVASTHAGNFVFHQGTKGKLSADRSWPVAVFNTILALPGDKMVRFADQGAAQITVDSGMATYNYTIPALVK
jgi:hypothetical protein